MLALTPTATVPTPTPTASATLPTATDTPTATTGSPTATNTPGTCASISVGTLTVNTATNTVTLPLTNTTGGAEIISTIIAEWIDNPADQRINALQRDGTPLLYANWSTPPVTINLGSLPASDRSILPTTTVNLEFVFGTTIVELNGYKFTIFFQSNCQVEGSN